MNGKTNGKTNGKSNGHGGRGPMTTVTFRISLSLKKSVQRAAQERDMTTTRFAVEALEDAVTDEPPRWWQKASRKTSHSTPRSRR